MPFIFFVGLVLVFLLILLFLKRGSLVKKQSSDELTSSEEKSYELLHQAMKKAQAILGQAELEEIKIIANSTLKGEKIESRINEQISEDAKQVDLYHQKQLALLSGEVSKASKAYQAYLDQLRSYVNQAQGDNQQVIREQVGQLFEKFEQNLTDYLTQTEQRSVMAIDLELRATRQLVETYKNQQLKLIDENIIAMLEKTLSTVLARKLTLKDQADLVYEALEKAKAEKFIL